MDVIDTEQMPQSSKSAHSMLDTAREIVLTAVLLAVSFVLGLGGIAQTVVQR
jgi:hypothetical protein